MSPQERERVSDVRDGGVLITEIKRELRDRCGRIHPIIWHARFPDMRIPLGFVQESSNLPLISSFRDGEVRHTNGNEEVDMFLSRSGLILEELVHYTEDALENSHKSLPDEVLGETSEENYRIFYGKASYLLRMLEEDVARQGVSISA